MFEPQPMAAIELDEFITDRKVKDIKINFIRFSLWPFLPYFMKQYVDTSLGNVV